MATTFYNSPIYKGISSFEFQSNKTLRLTDVELVKVDLLNHIFTKRGERVMMPNFGTRIPEMLFEPLDPTTVEVVASEIQRVLEYDPRVEIVQFDVRPNYDTNLLTVSSLLFFIELELTDNFNLNIETGL